MRAERIDEIARTVAAQARVSARRLVAVHESALVLLGIDNNAVPYGIDFLLPKHAQPKSGAWAQHGGGAWAQHGGDEYLALGGGGGEYAVRLWRTVGGRRAGELETVRHRLFSGRLLAPEAALELLPLSPDFRFLYEQRAAIAELLYFDRMPREQLAEFVRYVRL